MAPQYIYTMKGLTKVYPPDHVVLKDIWLSFLPGAKIGILGYNGAGKSTLLRVMAGVETEFSGEAFLAQGCSVGYLPQEPQLDATKDVRGNVEEGAAHLRGLLQRFDDINAKFGEDLSSDEMDKVLEEQGRVQDQIDAANAWDLDSRIELAMDALRLPPPDADVTTLSGGEKRRVALCRLLLQSPDLLLLDEPTNHLDAESVAWLETFLKDYAGTVVAITHDRYFLDNVAGWILELDRGEGIPWQGNYSSWLEQKQQRLAQEAKTESRRQRSLQRELEWIRMSPRARQAKGKARVSAYEELVAQESRTSIDQVEIYIAPGPRLGDIVVEARDIRKSFGDRLLMDGLTFTLPRGGIVGVIGPNGAGKTTLFRMITGQEQPDAGALRIGETVKIGYVDQSRDALAADRTVWEEITDARDEVELGKRTVASRAYVSWFNFKGRDQQKKVGTLSGGERNRVQLAKLLRAGSNLLLLDEPTNDLDVDTLRALEEALLDFAGCAVVISHDRWFLDRIATHMLAFEGDSEVVWFEGNYQDYEADRHRRLGAAADRPHRIKYRKLAMIFTSIVDRIAAELGVDPRQVTAAVTLLDEGATVPFIARYRKEVTGSLDDTQLRTLEARLVYLRELEERRTVILASVLEQGKLTAELEDALRSADTKTRLEDLYAPLRPKKRTKAQAAREQGLEPLAESLLGDPTRDPQVEGAQYVNEATGVLDVDAALDGARAILIERFSEDPELVGALRTYVWEHGVLRSSVIDGQQEKGQKFRDYFDGREPVKQAPSHRVLALLRGRKEGVLRLSVELPDADGTDPSTIGIPERRIAARAAVEHRGRPADDWLRQAVRLAWRARLQPKLEHDTEQRLRELAEDEAIRVFGSNLRDLLLAAPAGARVTVGLDPGIRTGVKVAVVDVTGAVAATATVYPHEPRKDWEGSLTALAGLCRQHGVSLVSIGNGTASRETERLVADLMTRHPDLALTRVVVSEAGASVYSASEAASKELPELDVTLRGAVSIARRLQDPLAELVKIEPKAIGVGQYQHDVSQAALARSLNGVVEDCVNAVGADVNTASPALLSRISGLSPRTATQIVEYRSQHGPFRSRTALLKVPRLGDKTFEQAAGFLRVLHGDDVLDASAVHPEAYPVVHAIARATGREVPSLVGDAAFLRQLDPGQFADDRFGPLTVRDILLELEKPGRDPRPTFKTARFSDGVQTLKDLQPGMTLEGVVTNVANFGAFVDIGVHHDGLVHVSQLADRFVKDPRDVVKARDIVSVTVLEIDLQRERVALTMRKAERPARPAQTGSPQAQRPPKPPGKAASSAPRARSGARAPQPTAPPPSTSMSAAFERLRRDR